MGCFWKKKKKDKYIDEGTETDPSKYSWLIFDRRVQFNGERTVFSTNGEGTTGHAHAKGKKKKKRRIPNTFYKR